LLAEVTWDNAERILHKVWGLAKLRGYEREEKLAFGALLSMFTRLRDRHQDCDGATIDAMAEHESNPGNEPMLEYFRTGHLTNERLRRASEPFGELAQQVVMQYRRTPERTVVLRKLLEAKDAAVRCALEPPS
jgi:hypothetical protein